MIRGWLYTKNLVILVILATSPPRHVPLGPYPNTPHMDIIDNHALSESHTRYGRNQNEDWIGQGFGRLISATQPTGADILMRNAAALGAWSCHWILMVAD